MRESPHRVCLQVSIQHVLRIKSFRILTVIFQSINMAPKRKNKKPASNPSRGFATTSTTSKAQASKDVPAEENVLEPVPDQHHNSQGRDDGDVSVERELHQLSPEEFEKQLEESDLNIFLEKHGEKVKRDVSRQINKLQTEKRLVRAQAEPLQTRSWLPPELVELILDAAEVEQSVEDQRRNPDGAADSDNLSEDDLSIRLWALKQVLVQLGFPYNLCQEALRYLLLVVQDATMRERLIGKDSIWGLDYCLDWLALHCDSHQAPSYSTRQAKLEVVPLFEQEVGNSPTSEKTDSGEGYPHTSPKVVRLPVANRL